MPVFPTRGGLRLLPLLACALPAHAGDRASYFYNASQADIRAVQVRSPGADSWNDVDVGGGIASATSRLLRLHTPGGGRCVYDIRTTFAQGPVLLHQRVDLCALPGYSPERFRQPALRRRVVSRAAPGTACGQGLPSPRAPERTPRCAR
jgi:hypothetical protein